ncbi:MAG: saccharopine dehydrogenase NADP-binding domain-containing protein [Candidatus Kapabacteria bacterium]|nr:saccharopine dehydrogenase NADP-binding domain-containing protein [Ignavibacteriota bacterium]MCW5884089.1 saccharopine dehydrogenase NADP-binding domain-containing protein [Candidatus Kapabacteria bacterium]
MAKILVLGAGMVGSAMAKDLSENHEVSSCDINENNLESLSNFNINTIVSDVRNKENLKSLVRDYDIILNAVPGFMGFETVKTVIESGKNVVDISFFPEDCFLLDEIAKSNKVTAIVDFGVAPGIPNLLLGYHDTKMNIRDYKCYVGGLPVKRTMPFQYKAPFSPVDVIEEYTRPARFVINNEIIVKDALSDPEFLEFDEIGTLEAFNTDGLRSLLFTNNIPNKIEKTLRYPGHIDLMRSLIKAGFLNEEPIEFNGMKISPRDFSSAILFDKWKLQPEENEFTVMRIIFEGIENGDTVRYEYNLLDRYNPETKISSMARTTGYAGTAAVNLLAAGLFENHGINPPEYVGKNDKAVDFVFEYMKDRNILYHSNRSILE